MRPAPAPALLTTTSDSADTRDHCPSASDYRGHVYLGQVYLGRVLLGCARHCPHMFIMSVRTMYVYGPVDARTCASAMEVLKLPAPKDVPVRVMSVYGVANAHCLYTHTYIYAGLH